MTIELTGNPPECKRKITGFYSLDRAFINNRHEIGVPVGVGMELFGVNQTGKSTFSYGFAGVLADPPGIALADFEGFDPDTLLGILETVKFDGKAHIVTGKDDEDVLDTLIKTLSKPDFSVGILDSIGAISPISELEGEIGEANMGRRAMAVAQFTRKALHLFRNNADTPKTILMINHWYPKIGSRGYDTPGGEVKKYLASIRILLRRKEEFPDGSYVLEGVVYKNRWGYKERRFYIFMLAGKGMHRGLTAMYDGTLVGLVERKKVIKIGDVSYGYIKGMTEEARMGNDEFFQPFIDALKDETHDITNLETAGEELPQVED